MTVRLSPVSADKWRLCLALNNIRAKCNSQTSDEAVFVQWLRDGLDYTRARNDHEQGTSLAWNQGACQVIDEILSAMETARGLVKTN